MLGGKEVREVNKEEELEVEEEWVNTKELVKEKKKKIVCVQQQNPYSRSIKIYGNTDRKHPHIFHWKFILSINVINEKCVLLILCI